MVQTGQQLRDDRYPRMNGRLDQFGVDDVAQFRRMFDHQPQQAKRGSDEFAIVLFVGGDRQEFEIRVDGQPEEGVDPRIVGFPGRNEGGDLFGAVRAQIADLVFQRFRRSSVHLKKRGVIRAYIDGVIEKPRTSNCRN